MAPYEVAQWKGFGASEVCRYLRNERNIGMLEVRMPDRRLCFKKGLVLEDAP